MEMKYCKACQSEHLFTEEYFRIYPYLITCRINRKKYLASARYKEMDKLKARKYRLREEKKKLISENKKRYFEKNRDKINEYKRKHWHSKQKHDVNFKLIKNLRGNLSKFLTTGVGVKKSKELLGLNLPAFKLYLQAQFQYGMTWDNYGKVWHLDHIIPLSRVDLTNKMDLQLVCHYSNIQPLFVADNIRKGNKL